MIERGRQKLSLKRILLLLFAVNVGVSIVQSGVGPIWPLYLKILGATVVDVSVVASVIGLVDMSLRTFTGLGSDIYGRRRFIILSSILSAVALSLYTFAPSWQHLVPLAMVYAASFAFFLPARTAFVADSSTPERRARAYSLIMLSWPVGSMLGPIMTGMIAEQSGWSYAFYAASAISAVTLIPGIMLPESKPARKYGRLTFQSLKPVAPFFVFNFLTGFGMGVTRAIIPLYVEKVFYATPTEVGFFFSIGSGLAMLAAQLPASWAPPRYGRRKTLISSFSFLPLMYLLWPLAGTYVILLLVYMAINGLWSMTWPSSLSLLMDAADQEKRGAITGFSQTALMLGFSVGPLLGGVLWEGISPAIPFYASAVILTCNLPLIPKLKSSATQSS